MTFTNSSSPIGQFMSAYSYKCTIFIPDDEKQSEEYSYLRVRTDLRTYIFRDRDRDYISRWYDALKSTQVRDTCLLSTAQCHVLYRAQ